jgi:hypothetical protein
MKTVFRFLTVIVLVATTLLVGCNTATPDELKVVGEIIASESERKHWSDLDPFEILDPMDSTRVFVKGYYKDDDAYFIFDVNSRTYTVKDNGDPDLVPGYYPSRFYVDTIVIRVDIINKWLPEIYKVNERKSKLDENERYFRYALMDKAMYSYWFKLTYDPYKDEAIVELPNGEATFDKEGVEKDITRIEYTGDLDNKIKQLFEVHPILVLNFYLSNNVEQNYANPEIMEVVIWVAKNRNLVSEAEFDLYYSISNNIISDNYSRAANTLYKSVTFVENKDKIDLLLNGKKISYIPMDVFDY